MTWNLTPETRERIRQARLGKRHPPETIEKLRAAATGKRASPETIEKLRQRLTGRHKSEETKARMRDAQQHRSPEHNRKIAEALRGRTLSAAHIETQRVSKLATGAWKPIGHIYTRRGYAWEKVSHGQGVANYKAQHRLVVERSIGRELGPKEHVHHLDGNTLNNSIDNLVLLTPRNHSIVNAILRISDLETAEIIVRTLMKRFPHLDS